MLNTPNTDTLSSTAANLSGDTSVALDSAALPTLVNTRNPLSSSAEITDAKQVTFIDTRVEDYQVLADHVIAGDVFFLDAARDGVAQIKETLANYDNLTGLQIVSHGNAGQLQLGSTSLNLRSIGEYEADLESWGDALVDTADVLLFGCNVADGEIGSEFVHQLAEITGADVAASTDLTGSEALKGDWDLEFSTGQIEADAAFASSVATSYDGVLATYRQVDEVRVLPLGDSITQGEIDYNSYRRPLWKKLNRGGFTKVDFVGTKRDNGQGPAPASDFDQDHSGYGGWRADQILSRIGGWARSTQPDVVLLQLGSNDMIQGNDVRSTIREIGQIVDELRNQNPNVAVLLSNVTPSISRRGGRAIQALANEIPKLARDKNRSGSPVILVDQNSGFDVNRDTYDGLHPNVRGEEKMAERWYGALRSLFNSNHQFRRGGNTGGGSGKPPTPAGNGNGLRADYFDNIDFTNLAVSRTDANVNFNWRNGSPDSRIGADTFSARWTGKVEARYDETYTFYTNSDDGVRLWVNGRRIIDKFRDQAPTEHTGRITLEAGKKYDIRMDYYEKGEGAVAQLKWSSASQAKQIIPKSQLYSAAVNNSGGNGGNSNTGGGNTGGGNSNTGGNIGGNIGGGNGLHARYYNTKNFRGVPIIRTDANINFNWGNGSPDSRIDADTFSVKWDGQVQALYDETYTFHTSTDDGVRLWINGQVIIDKLRNQRATEHTGRFRMRAGEKYTIRMEYFDNTEGAEAKLLWSSASQRKEIIPKSQLFS